MTAISQPAPTAAPGKVRNRILWTLQIVLGLFFIIASGLPKLLGEATAVHVFQQIGWGQWFRYLTGAVEVSGGLGLMIPRLTRAAAAGLTITMICAAATQIFLMHAPATAIFPLVLAVIFGWIVTQRR
ncbi:DoxX family protein [Nocardia sp. CA2R105]|uniref:DoxX family protein n=1 Tax=Nocardia coffeae TaxID=2873381 RepID=UPI001CA7AE45|nr:DoxX family protein [Nocardia coffeae]MBY8861500.1 DoxX family protein [Nocardia coffeae]